MFVDVKSYFRLSFEVETKVGDCAKFRGILSHLAKGREPKREKKKTL
jgi:hypothetical protein